MELVAAIFMGVIVGLACVIRTVSCLGWLRRERRRSVHISFVVQCFACLCGTFADAVFVSLVITGIIENLLRGSGFGFWVARNERWWNEQEIFNWLIIAFTLKSVHLLWILWSQCTVDYFVADCEPSKLNGTDNVNTAPNGNRVTGSVWRTYLLADVLLRLQVRRRLSPVVLFCCGYLCMTLISGVPLLQPVDYASVFWNMSLVEFPVDPVGLSSILRIGPYYFFTMASVTLLVIALVLYVISILRDRSVGNPAKELVDLCCWLNCSLVIRTRPSFGYYIHGKTVHHTAEFDFDDLERMIRSEEGNLVGKRGIQTDADTQTFTLVLPEAFSALNQQLLDQIEYQNRLNSNPTKHLDPVAFVNIPLRPNEPAGSTKGPITTAASKAQYSNNRLHSYYLLNRFYRRFLDHGFKEADYVVKWKNLLESFFDIEMENTKTRAVMYHDPKSTFTSVTLFGRTSDLMIFEILLYCVVSLFAKNFVFGLVSVLLFGFMLTEVCRLAGRANFVRTSCIDGRFVLY